MHPRIQELLQHLNSSRETLRQAVEAVPPARRQDRPEADRWSVAEIVEHLAIVEHRLAQLLGSRLKAAKANGLGKEHETSSVLEAFQPERLLDRSRRFVTGEASRPTAGVRADAAWAALERARGELLGVVAAGDGLALGEIAHPHPVLGTFTMYEWLAFLGAHDARHALQIREIADALGT
jgi:uncharacterized damage-inducible protein DinB